MIDGKLLCPHVKIIFPRLVIDFQRSSLQIDKNCFLGEDSGKAPGVIYLGNWN